MFCTEFRHVATHVLHWFRTAMQPMFCTSFRHVATHVLHWFHTCCNPCFALVLNMLPLFCTDLGHDASHVLHWFRTCYNPCFALVLDMLRPMLYWLLLQPMFPLISTCCNHCFALFPDVLQPLFRNDSRHVATMFRTDFGLSRVWVLTEFYYTPEYMWWSTNTLFCENERLQVQQEITRYSQTVMQMRIDKLREIENWL